MLNHFGESKLGIKEPIEVSDIHLTFSKGEIDVDIDAGIFQRHLNFASEIHGNFLASQQRSAFGS